MSSLFYRSQVEHSLVDIATLTTLNSNHLLYHIDLDLSMVVALVRDSRERPITPRLQNM